MCLAQMDLVAISRTLHAVRGQLITKFKKKIHKSKHKKEKRKTKRNLDLAGKEDMYHSERINNVKSEWTYPREQRMWFSSFLW